MFIKVVHLEDSMNPSRTSPRCTVPCPDGWFADSAIGSGSFEKDSPVEIVAMEKEQKTGLVHHHRLGKRHLCWLLGLSVLKRNS